jgi:hypothetical protein
MAMKPSLTGPLFGACCGGLASLGLALLLHKIEFVLVMAPGGLALGALLGWAVARMRHKFLNGLWLGPLCAFANGVVSGVVNALLGDPVMLHGGAERVKDGIGIGLLGCVILSQALVPIGVVSGVLVALVCLQPGAKPRVVTRRRAVRLWEG